MRIFCYFVEPSSYTLDLIKNVHSKLEIKCKNGHTFTQTFNNIKKRRHCHLCMKKSKFYNKFCEIVKSFGGICISDMSLYENSKSKLQIKCKNGHIFSQNLINIKKRKHCIECKKME